MFLIVGNIFSVTGKKNISSLIYLFLRQKKVQKKRPFLKQLAKPEVIL